MPAEQPDPLGAWSRSRQIPSPICDRVGCYESPRPACRCPARYCSHECRRAMLQVRNRERKWLWRNTLAGHIKCQLQAQSRQAARRAATIVHIGIDYSGRETATSRTPALQVDAAFNAEDARRVQSADSTEKTYKNWCRKEIAEWLIEQARANITFIAGIDHGFSFPLSYFKRYNSKSWPRFLDDFCEHWPTDTDHTYVDFIRHYENGSPDRTG